MATVVTPAFAAGRTFFGIATGGTGGTYYPLGGMLAQLISNTAEMPDTKISATAETGNASVANAQLLGRGEIESAFVAADILDAASRGVGQFEGAPLENLRAIGALYPETVQLVVRADSGIETFEDLKGKSISSGSPGSGQWQLLGDLLEAHGIAREEVSEDYSSFSQSVDKIKDGNLDALVDHSRSADLLGHRSGQRPRHPHRSAERSGHRQVAGNTTLLRKCRNRGGCLQRCGR